MDLFPGTNMVQLCMGQRIWHGVESFYICPCAFTGLLCFEHRVRKIYLLLMLHRVKGETVCREYRLQIKGSDNTAFFGGQRDAESRWNTLQYVNAMPCMLELGLSAAGESPCLHPVLDGILFVTAKQLPSPNCFSDELIDTPLLDITVAAGSAQKILMHELCMLSSFFSLRA